MNAKAKQFEIGDSVKIGNSTLVFSESNTSSFQRFVGIETIPTPVLLVKERGHCKVDPRAIIAGRLAAAKFKKSGK